MANNAAWYGVGLGGIILIVIFVFLITHLRQAKKKSKLEASRLSPSSFNAESKTKMMSRLDKRESILRRERILEGGSLPELNELVVYYPTRNEKIASKEIDVRGKTTVKSIVWINNQAAFVDLDGSFIGTIKLFKGKNNIDLVVIGPYGRAMKTSIPVQCTAKDAPSTSSSNYTYLLPEHTLDIRTGSPVVTGSGKNFSAAAIKRPTAKLPGEAAGQPQTHVDPIVVSESEIDPAVLAALKGETLIEASPTVGTTVDLDELEPEPVVETAVSVDEIPPIPDVIPQEGKEELTVPPIPTAVEKEEEPEEEVPVIDEDLVESVKLLEEVVEESETFEPDKMLPKQPSEGGVSASVKEEPLTEFEPLQEDVHKGLQELIVETKRQELDDGRKTVILQHIGLLRTEDGELIQILKIEKRIECVLEKWYSTLGFVNVSEKELKRVEIKEFISDTAEFTGKLPVNVEEPVVEHLPKGVQLSWVINDFKPQMKLFITYNEKVNPLEVLKPNQVQPKITVLL